MKNIIILLVCILALTYCFEQPSSIEQSSPEEYSQSETQEYNSEYSQEDSSEESSEVTEQDDDEGNRQLQQEELQKINSEKKEHNKTPHKPRHPKKRHPKQRGGPQARIEFSVNQKFLNKFLEFYLKHQKGGRKEQQLLETGRPRPGVIRCGTKVRKIFRNCREDPESKKCSLQDLNNFCTKIACKRSQKTEFKFPQCEQSKDKL